MTSEIKITRFVIGKGKTTKPSKAEEWVKSYYEIEVEVPETYTRESIEEIRLQIEAMITDWLSEPEHESKEKPKGDQAPIQIRQLFPKELEKLLNFEEQEKWIKVSPKRFLGSDNFARIMTIVRDLSGEYVSAGKNSHFKIPKT